MKKTSAANLGEYKPHFDYEVDSYLSRLSKTIQLDIPTKVDILKKVTIQLFLGRNYRLVTEHVTKEDLIATYTWIDKIIANAIKKFPPPDKWQEKLLSDIDEYKLYQKTALNKTEKELEPLKHLKYWLLGLPEKTAKNLDIRGKEQIEEALTEISNHFKEIVRKFDNKDDENKLWLLSIAGAATLNVRGSRKSSIGKELEKAFLGAAFTLLGLEKNKDYWLDIAADNEVARQADAEIRTKRGRIKCDIGLISDGNPEVIFDKALGRVGRNGIVIFDKLGAGSLCWKTAGEESVKLIQIRGTEPLKELKAHLETFKPDDVEIKTPPHTEAEITLAVNSLPDSIFKEALELN